METLETKPQPMIKYAATYGLYIGLALVLLLTIDYVFKLYGQNTFLGLLNYVVIIGGIVYFTIMYRDKVLGGYISYGQSLAFGILLVIFASVVSSIFSFLLNIIDPLYVEKQLEMMADKMMQMGLSEDQIEQSMKISRIMRNPIITLLVSVFGGALTGTIFSLVTSIFTKKQKSIF